MIKNIDPTDDFVQEVFDFLAKTPGISHGTMVAILSKAYGFDTHVSNAFVQAYKEFNKK